MPLDLAAALRRHLLQRFPADRAYPRTAFHADGMPPLVAAFLDRTLDRWVEIERTELRSDWFDFDDADVRRAEERFFDALGRAARIPADAWEETLGGAVDLVVRFLTMPARALTDAIFEGEDAPLPTTEVRARLPLFDAYPYLAEVATAYLDRKQPEPLAPPALFALLDRIDRRVVTEYGREDWLDLLRPLFDLARYAPTLDGVPAARLQQFFEAKGEANLAGLLAEHAGAVLDEEQLRDVLAPAFPAPAEPEKTERDAMPPSAVSEPETSEPEPSKPVPPGAASGAKEPAAEPDEPKPVALEPVPGLLEPIAPPVEPEIEAPKPDAEAAVEEEPKPEALNEAPPLRDEPRTANDTPRIPGHDPADPVPLWQRFAERTSDGDSVNARFGAEDAGTDASPTGEVDAPLWKRFFSRDDTRHDEAAPAAPPAPIPSPKLEEPNPDEPKLGRSDSLDTLEMAVLGAVSLSQRAHFVRHLFGGDAGKYAAVLRTLEAAASWTEASQIIARDVFRPSRVNIYSEHAVAFTDAVEARFRA